MTKVIKVDKAIYFDDGSKLYDYHDQDCCESHFLDFDHITLDDFEGAEFDLSGEFFKKIEDYGIELVPVKGYSVKIPGYGYNNGYYGTNIDLILVRPDGSQHIWDVTECQELNDG